MPLDWPKWGLKIWVRDRKSRPKNLGILSCIVVNSVCFWKDSQRLVPRFRTFLKIDLDMYFIPKIDPKNLGYAQFRSQKIRMLLKFRSKHLGPPQNLRQSTPPLPPFPPSPMQRSVNGLYRIRQQNHSTPCNVHYVQRWITSAMYLRICSSVTQKRIPKNFRLCLLLCEVSCWHGNVDPEFLNFGQNSLFCWNDK